MLEPQSDPIMDFDEAMHFATRTVNVLRMHLAAARWAQPDRYDALEALLKEASDLGRRIERERRRAQRDANDS
jgi:hypothetical protein